MFEIGFSEMLVIAVVALVVLGPERLPKAARFAGLWMRRARQQWDSVKNELERELAAEEIKRNIADTEKALRDGQANLFEQAQQAETAVKDVVNDAQQHLEKAAAQATTTASAAEHPVEHARTEDAPADSKHDSAA